MFRQWLVIFCALFTASHAFMLPSTRVPQQTSAALALQPIRAQPPAVHTVHPTMGLGDVRSCRLELGTRLLITVPS